MGLPARCTVIFAASSRVTEIEAVTIEAVTQDDTFPEAPPAIDARQAILLIAKSAFAVSPHAEMQRIAGLVAGPKPGAAVRFAFTEQGKPSLRDALSGLVDEEFDGIVIVPLVLPMEPSFHIWLTRSLNRWKAADTRPWPALSKQRLRPPSDQLQAEQTFREIHLVV